MQRAKSRDLTRKGITNKTIIFGNRRIFKKLFLRVYIFKLRKNFGNVLAQKLIICIKIRMLKINPMCFDY